MDRSEHYHVISQKRQKLEKLSIPTLEGFSLIDTKDILYLESESSYTTIYFQNGTKITATKNLKYFEEELINEPFLRVHNCYVVNIAKVDKYIKADEGYVILNTGLPIKVSRGKRDTLVEFFQMRRHLKPFPPTT
jgi:two-component system LytT family response regulator